MRLFSCKGEGSESIHYQIDPKKLNSGHWGLSHPHGAEEDDEEAGEVDSNLELKESTEVLVDVSTPHDRSKGRFEIIVGDDHIRDVSS